MVQRRTHSGLGTVFFDTAKNRWVAAVPLPPGLDGKRRRRQRTFPSKRDAVACLSQPVTDTPPVPEVLLVGDLLDGWFKARERRAVQGELSPKTMEISGHVARRIRACLGRYEAESLSVDDIEEFLVAQASEVSLRYVQMQRNVLDQAYKWAARNRLLTWNPAVLASLPHTTRSDHGQVLTADQAANLLESSRGSRWHALWATMLGAGLRPGEALALTWPCLDLDQDPGVLHVRHYLRTGTGGPFLGEPKTARSSRSLDLPHFTTQALKQLQEVSDSPCVGVWAGLVFHTDTDQPIGLPNARRALRRACADAGLPRLCLYDLRRTAGSLLVDAGVHLEQVADLLGHADVATTRRHYVRAIRPTVPQAVHLDEVLTTGANNPVNRGKPRHRGLSYQKHGGTTNLGRTQQ